MTLETWPTCSDTLDCIEIKTTSATPSQCLCALPHYPLHTVLHFFSWHGGHLKETKRRHGERDGVDSECHKVLRNGMLRPWPHREGIVHHRQRRTPDRSEGGPQAFGDRKVWKSSKIGARDRTVSTVNVCGLRHLEQRNNSVGNRGKHYLGQKSNLIG